MTGPPATVAELIHRHTGICVPAARMPALRAALRRAAPGLAEEGVLGALADPAAGRGLLDRLIDEVTVQETAFVRDRDQLDPIPWHSLAETAAGGVVRVWSAGCATGEEVYTLALLATESLAPARPRVDVLGTDISTAALAAAQAGRYRERAVRGLDARLRRRYLERQPDGSYLVTARLRALARFRRHNLIRDSAPPHGEGMFDLIVCRNVLIYFDPATVTGVCGRLERSLTRDGMLVLGAADVVARTAALGRAVIDPAGRKPRARATARPATREQRLAAAHAAADRGDRARALAQVTSLLADDPLDADAQFLHGLVMLEAGEPAAAAAALRRALYIDPGYAVAAFTLGRAYDAVGDVTAALRAYAQALRSLDPADQRHEPMLQQIDLADIAAACRARLRGRA